MRRGERGQSLVEAALIIPVLFIFLAGVIDVGRAFTGYIIVANAAREGARVGMRLPCHNENATQRSLYRDRIVQAAIAESSTQGLPLTPANVVIDPDPADSCAAAGGPLRVGVEFPIPTILGSVLGMENVTVRSQMEVVFFGVDD